MLIEKWQDLDHDTADLANVILHRLLMHRTRQACAQTWALWWLNNLNCGNHVSGILNCKKGQVIGKWKNWLKSDWRYNVSRLLCNSLCCYWLLIRGATWTKMIIENMHIATRQMLVCNFSNSYLSLILSTNLIIWLTSSRFNFSNFVSCCVFFYVILFLGCWYWGQFWW